LELAVILLDLIEQPHVLNGYDCLIGECRNQFDLLVSERRSLSPN
jgi:hypothetical protein